MVFAWHFTHAWYGYPIPFEYVPAIFPLALLDEGHTGVALFMTLSGYLFAKLLDGKTIDYAAFLWNRALRLFPLLGVVVVIVGIGPGEAAIGASIVRVDFPGLLKKFARRRIAFTREFMPLVPASHKVIVGSEAIRVFPGQARDLGLSQFAGRPPSVPAMDCVMSSRIAKMLLISRS